MSSPSKIRVAGPARVRFLLVKGSVMLAFALLAGRLVWVQGVMRTDYQQKADRRTASVASASTARNSILDRDGRVLVDNVQVYSCFADPTLIKDRAATARAVAPWLRMDPRTVSEKIASARGSFVWIKRNVSPDAVQLIKEKQVPGIGFRVETRRHYPTGPIATHLLGMVGFDGNGLSGVEQAFEPTLNARRGGGKLPAGHVKLTIDARIQRIVERELDWGGHKTGAKRGIAVVQDPNNGEILAMAAWPPMSLEPERPPKPGDMRVPALVDAFEPGSTFKIVTAAAVLEENLIHPGEMFNGENGKWKVYNATIHDHEPRALLSFDDILIYSSNIGAAKLAERLGAEKLYQYARLFGFGAPPGSCLPSESKGLLRPPSQWSGLSKYTISFGQEVSVTALQLVGAYSAIANGGQLLEPRVVSAIVGDDGKPLWQNPPAVVRRVVSDKTAKDIARVLALVVKKGTGVNAQIQWDPSMEVAGKTGTAQKYDRAHHRYNDTLSLVSFCGFFPARQAKYTILVLYDEPEGRSWGGLDAAPVFRRIAEQLSPRTL
ncbi:MAG: penicillin-binding protein 2, partial [Elusimicrobia bacterium]|nr:penicillin-binding protein 2 [Elusimicrobiota bacterium]